MTSFKDLEFIPHEVIRDTLRAQIHFKNGYGASVITGFAAYGGEGEYELAVLKDGKPCYNTPITDNVIGYQTPEQITELLKQIENL